MTQLFEYMYELWICGGVDLHGGNDDLFGHHTSSRGALSHPFNPLNLYLLTSSNVGKVDRLASSANISGSLNHSDHLVAGCGVINRTSEADDAASAALITCC